MFIDSTAWIRGHKLDNADENPSSTSWWQASSAKNIMTYACLDQLSSCWNMQDENSSTSDIFKLSISETVKMCFFSS